MVVEMSKGADVGKYTGIYYTFSMAAQIATPFVTGFLFDLLPIKYRILFPYSALFLLVAFVTMLFVHHGDGVKESEVEAVA
jgi:MFS family permease